MIRSTLAAGCLAALVPVVASAQTLCSAPIAPLCVDLETTYADPATTDRCRQDLDGHAAAIEDYGACLERQIEELRRARRDLEDSFVCRAGGLEDCPDTDSML